MKTRYLTFILLFMVFLSQGQEAQNETSDVYNKPNELKLNGIMLLVGAFEASYERNLNEESSIGISAFIPFDKENFDTDINYYLSPYYRIFFGKKYAAGFFVEGFGMLNSLEVDEYFFQPNGNLIVNERNETNFALGFGLGGKWISRGGFIFELTSGIGRNLFNGDADVDIVGKFAFNLGYRF